MGQIKNRYFCYSLIVFFTIGIWSDSFGSIAFDPFPWRPTKSFEIIKDPDQKVINNLKGEISYTKSDDEVLWTLIFSLSPDQSTQFLKGYIKKYKWKKNDTDLIWARAVYGLGLAQTEAAQDELLRLWNFHDRRLQRWTFNFFGKETRWRRTPPLAVIGDALHFYLDDAEIREWFIARIKEAEGIKTSGTRDLAKRYRRSARIFLLTYMYRWDIVESVDGDPLAVEKVMMQYPFSRKAVKNIDKSAERFVERVKDLPSLQANISESQWRKSRTPNVLRLEAVAYELGENLALAVWDNYLSKELEEGAGIEHRVWQTCLITYSHSLIFRKTWKLSERERQFLRGEIQYISNLPPGHLKHLNMRGLYLIYCYWKTQESDELFNEIEALAEVELDQSDREGLINIVQHNLKKVAPK